MEKENRILEAEKNVKAYLEDELIKKQEFKQDIFNVLYQNSKESFELSNFIFKNNKSDLWVIVTSYYSMFYIANAVLYKIGYKVGDKIPHKVTADSLYVFIKNKLKKSILEEYEEIKNEALAGMKAEDIINDFDKERSKRSRIQYNTNETEKHAKAITSLNRAKIFIFEMEKIL